MDVVAAEGPIHVELAARRWGQTVGYRRVSKRIYDGFIQTVVGDAKKWSWSCPVSIDTWRLGRGNSAA